MIFITRICTIVLLSLISVSGSFGQTNNENRNDFPAPNFNDVPEEDRYRIGFNDTVAIRVFRHPDLTQTVNVNTNGTINVFRIPTPIVAVCKTERELAEDIAEAYRKDYLRNPEVNVTAVEQRSQAFSVIGAIERPGSYFNKRRVRLIELIAHASGPSEKAGTRLVVARTGSTSNCKLPGETTDSDDDDFTHINFKMRDVLEARQNLVMQPGDVVYVLEADSVYVYGNVNKQGKLIMNEPLTLTQAIATAEGLKPATRKGKVRVIRQIDDGKDRQELVFDLREIDRGDAPDPFLEPNDIVAVSEDKIKSVLNSVRESLTQGSSLLFDRIP